MVVARTGAVRATTLAIFKNGKIVWRISGVMSSDELQQELVRPL
ncbi:MAG: thioredoxin family protein [Flavobacteriales bacterium]|nr:thioredoxin family protein [Flavobacteriales bacterium]